MSESRKSLLDGFGEATEQVVSLRAEVTRLQAQVEAMKAVVDAARMLRRTAGLANKHRAKCETPSCERCRVLRDMEADMALDLDVQLLQLEEAHA